MTVSVWVETNGDMINLPELLRVKGVVLASMPEPRVDEAEANLIRSLEQSRRQGARAGELRTATDLARLMAAQGRRAGSPRTAANGVQPWFDEGCTRRSEICGKLAGDPALKTKCRALHTQNVLAHGWLS